MSEKPRMLEGIFSNEKKDANAIKTHQRVYFLGYRNCDKEEVSCTYAQTSIPVADSMMWGTDEASIVGKFNDFIQNVYAPEKKILPFEKNAKNFIKDWENAGKEVKGYDFSWLSEKEVVLLSSNRYYFSLMASEFSFTGGAHPNTMVSFSNFSLPHLKALTLSDIIYPQKIKILEKLVEKKFRIQNHIPQNHSFSDFGYSFENNHFPLAKNFSFYNQSMVFFYNSHEMANDSRKWVLVEVPLKDLENIVRPDWKDKLFPK